MPIVRGEGNLLEADADALVNPVNAVPELLRCDSDTNNNWVTVKAVGVKSNRSAVGARVRCVTDDGTQIDEVRSGGSYYSQNDLRVHFGVGRAQKIKTLEIRWPSGMTDVLSDVAVNRILVVREGSSPAKPAPEQKP